MASNAYHDIVQKLYVAFYGRPADPIGREFWASRIDAAGGNVASVVTAFAASAEANVLFPGSMTTAQLVNSIYLQAFGRNAEPDGLAYWAANIDSGTFSRGEAMSIILSNASGADLMVVQAKLAAANEFTAALDTVTEMAGYSGVDAASAGRAYLNPVHNAATLAAAIAALDTTIHDIVTPSFSTPSRAISVSEHQSTVGSFTASATSILTYGLSGDDAVNFTIDEATGHVTFFAAPDFEAPGSSVGTNVYRINVIATDVYDQAASQAVTVTVTNVNEAPSMTVANTTPSVGENTTDVTTLSSSDPDLGDTVTYLLSGADAGCFHVAGHLLQFNSAPDFEAPSDANGDNVYQLTLTARDADGLVSASIGMSVTVTDVIELRTFTLTAGANSFTGRSTDADLFQGDQGTGLLNTTDVLDGGASTDRVTARIAASAAPRPTVRNVEEFDLTASGAGTATLNALNVEAGGDGLVVVRNVRSAVGTTLQVTNLASLVDLELVNLARGAATILKFTDPALTATGQAITVGITSSAAPAITLDRMGGGNALETVNLEFREGPTDLTLNVNAVNTTTVNLAGAEGVTLRDQSGMATVATVNASALEGSFAFDAGGSAVARTIRGASGNFVNTITGGNAADSIMGGTAADVLAAGAGNDTIDGGGGADTITGGAGIDTLMLAGDYTGLTAFSGNNSISGIEAYVFASQGTGAGHAGFSYDITLDEGEVDNGVITVDAAGLLADADLLAGGSQDETLHFSASQASLYKVSISGGAANDIIIGGLLADTISGGEGQDSITGGAGENVLNGGGGNDTYFYASTDLLTADIIADDGAADWDVVNVMIAWRGGGITDAMFENKSGIDALWLNGAGYQAPGNDVTIGALAQAAGIRTVSLDDSNELAAGGYTVGLTVYAHFDSIVMTGSGDDMIDLWTGHEWVSSGDGNDVINGLTDTYADTISAGNGDDWVTVGPGGDIADAGAGNDNIWLYGTGNSVTAGPGDDTVYGHAYLTNSDTLAGGEGTDQLILSGDCDLTGANALDGDFTGFETIYLETGPWGRSDPGPDTAGDAYVYAITLGHADNAAVGTTLTVHASRLRDDVITHLGADNEIGGVGADADTLTAETLTLTATAVAGSVSVLGGAGSDTVTGSNQADTIVGNGGNDVIDGGVGADTYVFAATGALNGNDTLAIVAADDVFNFAAFLSSGSVEQNGGEGATIIAFTSADGNDVDITRKVAIFDVNGAGPTIAQLAAKIEGAGNAFALNGKAVVITGDATSPANAALIYFIDSSLDGSAANVTANDIVLVGTTSAAFDIDSLTTANFAFA